MHLYSYMPLALAAIAPVLIAADTTCPDGSGPSTVNNTPLCCPGIVNTDNSVVNCLVDCSLTSYDCYPFCTGTTRNDLFTVGPCSPVPVTAAGYTSIVYSMATASATGSAVLNTGAGTSTPTPTSTSTSTSKGAAAITPAPVLAQAVLGAIAGLVML